MSYLFEVCANVLSCILHSKVKRGYWPVPGGSRNNHFRLINGIWLNNPAMMADQLALGAMNRPLRPEHVLLSISRPLW